MEKYVELYKLKKEVYGIYDIYDLIEVYYPNKHKTIVNMRKIAYSELVKNGIIDDSFFSSSKMINQIATPPFYKDLTNTYFPIYAIPCPKEKFLKQIEKLSKSIDLLVVPKVVNKGVKADLFSIGEALDIFWFPYTLTSSHLKIEYYFVMELAKDINDDIDVLDKLHNKGFILS